MKFQYIAPVGIVLAGLAGPCFAQQSNSNAGPRGATGGGTEIHGTPAQTPSQSGTVMVDSPQVTKPLPGAGNKAAIGAPPNSANPDNKQ